MGEHARYKGEQVKIGTCENLYYLRADQRHEVEGYSFALDVLRFRFPFPDEDGTEPGHFEDYNRGVRVPGYSLPAELSGDEHRSVQFTSTAGYVLCVPCPEQFGTPGMTAFEGEISDRDGFRYPLRIGRNGFNGGPVVRQQAYRGGVLVTLLSCNACGALHRLDTIEDARPVAEAFREEAKREDYRQGGFEPRYSEQSRRRLHEIADRIEAGYALTPEGVSA